MRALFLYTAMVLCSLLSWQAMAQQKPGTRNFRGKVLFLSSGKTPAVGVEVSGVVPGIGNANIMYTTSDGSYELVFPKAAVGKPVVIRVGNRDSQGKELELVNNREVSKFRIPAIAIDDHDIIVCEKGARDTVAERYYKIIKSSSELEIKKIKDEIDSLLAQTQKDYQRISMLSDKIVTLRQRSDSVVMYREAFRLASINKDNATKRVLEYLALLDQGKLIQEAREVLSIELAAGDMEEGIEQFNAAIEELEIRAQASRRIFDYEDAIDCYTNILGHLEKMEADRLIMARYYHKLAEVSFIHGDYTGTLEYQELAMTTLEKVLDSLNPELAEAYSSIGKTYQALGQYKKAFINHQRSIAIRQATLDPKDPKLATAYNNAGNIHRALGRYKAALDYQQKALSIMEDTLDPEHPQLAAAYNDIALTCQRLGRYARALKYQQKALKIWKTLTDAPEYRSSIAAAYNNTANTYRASGRYIMALGYQQKAVDSLEKIVDSGHPELACFYNNIGISWRLFGRYAIALDYQLRSVAILEKALDSVHPELAKVYSSIGKTYQVRGEDTIALEYYQRSLAIREVVLSPEHPDLATSYGNIGIAYHNLGRYGKALEYQYKSLNILEVALAPQHPRLATAYNDIAANYRALGRYATALKYHQKAIAIQKRKSGRRHPQLAISYMNIAITYGETGALKKAIRYQEKCLDIFNTPLLKDHPYREKAMHTLAELYQKAIAAGYHNKKWIKKDIRFPQRKVEKTFIKTIEKPGTEKQK